MADASYTLETPPPDARRYDPLAVVLPSRTEVLLEWLAGQPLVPPALGIALGIALDFAWHAPFIVPLVVFLASGLILFHAKATDAHRHIAAGLAALCLGAMLHDAAYRRWPADSLVQYCGPTRTPARLVGTVLTMPQVRQAQSGPIEWFEQPPVTRFVISAESLEGIDGPITVEGAVAIRVHEKLTTPRPGDRVEIFGRMYRPTRSDDADERNWSRISRRSGILVQMSCDHDENVTILPTDGASSGLRHLLSSIRRRARRAMLDRTWPGDVPGSNLLEALVLGQRSAVDPAINQAFVDTGTVHYLSVSGAHVGMLASALWMFAALGGLSRRGTALWISIVITAYGLLAEPTPPVWRSVIMGNALCAAVLLRRPVRAANALALSAIILLVIHPTDLFDPGFQLSFGTLISLIYLGPSIGRLFLTGLRRLRGVNDPLLAPEIQRLFHPRLLRRAGWFVESRVALILGVGVAAWLAGLAPGAWHFQQVSLWGWLNSLLLAPVVWLALVFGLLKTVVGAVWPLAGGLFAWPITGVTEGLIDLVNLLTRLPGSPLPPMHVTGVGVVAFSVVLLMWMLRGWLRLPRSWPAIGTCAFALIALWRMAPPVQSGELRLQILSVGSGSAHLIRLPNGKSLLYDMGARPPYDIQRWTLGPLLARHNIYQLDALLLSHPDLDHFSSVPELLNRVDVRQAIVCEPFEPLSPAGTPSARLLRELRSHELPIRALSRGQSLAGADDAHIECLWPAPAADMPSTLSTNDSSLVIRVSYAGFRVLLCGDIEDYAQRRLIRESDVRADVLVLPHHGAVTSYTRSLIEAVNPVWCIRSSGQRDVETRSGLLAAVAHRRYLNTADAGDITIRMRPGELHVSGSREGG